MVDKWLKLYDLTCPFCFSKFGRHEIVFRCINDDCSVKKDEKLEKYRGSEPKATELRKISEVEPNIKNLLFVPQAANCAKCNDRTTIQLCPNCHNKLPDKFGTGTSLKIALVGAKGVGKSQYIGVLIKELLGRLSRVSFPGELVAEGMTTQERYESNYHQYIKQGHVVPETDSVTMNTEIKEPLVYAWKITLKNRWNIEETIKVNLSFFDTAGEDLNDINQMSSINRYIAYADGIILLLDPTQFPKFYSGKNSAPNQFETLRNVTTLITRHRPSTHLSRVINRGKIPVPIAVTFSKIDEMHDEVDARLLRASEHKMGFDVEDAEIINQLFQAYLVGWQGENNPSIYRHLKQNYTQSSFFGVSALGGSPVGEVIPNGINPFRIEDPLLWILYQHHIIPAMENRKEYA